MSSVTVPMSFSKDPVLPPIRRPAESNDILKQMRESNFGLGVDDFSFSSKLTNVEAQRIISVIQDVQKKVSLINLLPDFLDRRVQSVFSSDTVNMISEHRQLEQRYKQLVESDKPTDSQNTELKEIIRQLKASTRTLYRNFVQNPTAMSKLRYLKSTKLPVVAQFEQLLQEMKILVYERLKTTVEEEKAKQDQLSIIIAKEQKTSNEVKVLQEEWEKAKRERANEISKKNDLIRRLKDELREIKQQAEEATKRLETRSKQKEDMDSQQFRDKEVSLKQEIASLKTQLEETVKKNREEEAQLRKKKFKIESEVENWIHKYDQEMEEKQNEIEDIAAIFSEEKTQLDELQQRYTDLQKAYNQILEDRRIVQEQKKEKEKQLRRMNDAATLIQAIWKGFKVRKEMKKKKEKGKEKKGKKGKK
ncbi:hypothetical protein HK098_007223 [Nowakowskiella sp. JEL0407]|nr:hypothetical protein HK098_007223 [Nowakowskiella sp. JEL0407]